MVSLIGALLNRSDPLPFARMSVGNFPSPSPRGTRAGLAAMEQIGTVFGIVNRSAEVASAVEWKLFRKRSDGRRSYAYEGMDERTEVTQHLALKVWNKPNKFMTRQELVEIYAQHMYLTGEAWWHLPRMNGFAPPLEIWPMRPDRVLVLENNLSYISGYEYCAPDGQRIPLDVDEVVFSRRPDPLSEYRGVGPVQSVLAKIDSVRFSDEWNRNFFLNDASPGGIIKVARDIDDAEYQRLQFRWNEAHKGVGNAHRVAILDGEDMDWVERQAVHREMQFAELSQVNSEQIREAFGFPKSMLGTSENVNRANAEAGEYMFTKHIVVPLLERIKSALNNEFLPLFGSAGEGVEFDYCSPVPEDRAADARDRESKTLSAKTLIDGGVYGPEALEAVGMPPLSFGEPGADPQRELLITLVTRAPTLAPTILPLLGFELPQQSAPPSNDNVVTEGGDPDAPPAEPAAA